MFGTPDQYTKVLNIVGTCTFMVTGLCTLAILQVDPNIPRGPTVEIPLQFAKANLPLAWAAAVILLALIFRVIKLHDRISDFFGIREAYDITYIIRPIYSRTTLSQTVSPTEDSLAQNRRALMKAIFYKYVPGPPGKNAISDHLVAMAWESLCWFWVTTEAAFITFCFALLSIALRVWPATLAFLIGSFIFLAIAVIGHKECRKQTEREVEAILDDAKRRDEIRSAIHEILH